MGRHSTKKTSKVGSQLGRAIIRDRFGHHKQNRDAPQSALDICDLDADEDLPVGIQAGGLRSVVETNDLSELLDMAIMADRDFAGEKDNMTIVDLDARPMQGVQLSESEKKEALKVPRRPDWRGLSAAEVEQNERRAFLEWRRGLARLDEAGVILTPFEKNLEIWRQLWRVVERSHVVVQILDARNPLLFRCQDLEDLVRECDPKKRCVLLLNKADLVPRSMRKEWARYFSENKIEFLFFSALEVDRADFGAVKGERGPTEVVGLEELIDILHKIAHEAMTDGAAGAPDVSGHNRATVGMVGFPNVGKSSTINKLCGSKRVRVGATPGKTKHLQTILIGEDLCLCDCPGLVFPSMVASKAEMVCNGILPIDSLREHRPPIDLVCQTIPREYLERTYGVVLPARREGGPPWPSVDDVLITYGCLRGYMTSHGRPDEPRSARYILKDYVAGKLCHVVLPPDTPLSLESELRREHLNIVMSAEHGTLFCEPPEQESIRPVSPKVEAQDNIKERKQPTAAKFLYDDALEEAKPVGVHAAGRRNGKGKVNNEFTRVEPKYDVTLVERANSKTR